MPREANSPGWVRGFLNVYHAIPTGTGAVEIVTDLNPGFKYIIEKVTAVVAVAGTGTSASRTYRVLKGASTVVATRTLALADTATVGAQIPFTVNENEMMDADVLTVDFASGGTAFTAGALNLIIQYRTRAQQR
jgi:hypothetical protein